jgi:heat-inducible transcriptional repressor
MLDDRKAAILRVVVQEYIETAQPVGSAHVAQATNLAVSSATVRNEMAVLEHEGYLVQPHTSAGRIPTDKGYRFFVDQLTEPGVLGPEQRERVRDFFDTAHGELERMLHDTSRLLSSVTDYAAVVVSPPHEEAIIRSVQLVALAPRVALVVVVLGNGVVEKRTIDLPDGFDEVRVSAAGARLSAHLVGHTLSAGGNPPWSTGDDLTDGVVASALEALGAGHAEDPDQVFMGGVARMAGSFDAVDTVRQVLGTLEQQYVVVTLLRDVLDRGLSVAIGSEHGLAQLATCAVVVAPYEVEGLSGTVGVLGPTRMNYPLALAAVALVSQRLGKRLSEG